jgi:CheY-like chemotaxis protein
MAHQFPTRRVLVVDDNRDAADILSEFLQLSGHEAAAAYGGQHALDVARHFLPDIVLLDLGMPGIDGFAVAAALLRDQQTCHMRVIALTAWGDAATRARTSAVGFHHHLTKPTDFSAILAALI